MRHPQRWIVGLSMLAAAHGATANEAAKAQEVVDKATATYNEFITDPNMGWFRANVGNAKGMLIVPTYGKAGFIIGGAGGSGLLVANDPAKGWSNPAFYTMAEASFGLQIGAQGSQMIFLVMTDRGMQRMVEGKAKLGADMNVAVGPVGGGASVETADVYAYAKSKGAYGGVSAEGGIVQAFNERNAAYYGQTVSATDIIMGRTVSNDGAKALIGAIAATR